MADTSLVRASWWRSAWNTVMRKVGFQKSPSVLSLGADYAGGLVSPSYDVAEAMSAYAAFPWVVACANAISTDLSGVPLRVQRGRGKSAEQLTEHPVLDLLERPSSRTSGVLYRRQVLIDLTLTGNAYTALLYASSVMPPVSLRRCHPERMKIEPDQFEGIGAYLYEGGANVQALSPDDVLHVRNPSWESGPEGFYGQGVIRALKLDLTTDLRSQRLAANLAKRGRPDLIISPSSEFDQWPEKVRLKIRENVEKLLSESGALVISHGIKLDLPSWTPRDLEFEKVRLMAREAVLACFGVPPVIVAQDSSANYATAREQKLVYWEKLVGIASLLDEELTRLAQKWDRSLRVYHDFSRIDALQYTRNERLDRVTKWVFLGATPAAAAAYEGFDDAPVEDVLAPAEPAPAPEPKALPEPARRTLTRMFGPTRQALIIPRDEDGRAALWRGFEQNLHQPTERAYGLVFLRALEATRARVAERLASAYQEPRRTADGMVQRGLLEDIVGLVWDDAAERAALRAAVRPAFIDAIQRAFRTSAGHIGADLTFDPARINLEVNRLLGSLVTNVSAETRARVQALVEQGIADGSTVQDIQHALMSDAGFSASRALRIARTEATRSVNAGATEAYRAAAAEGISVRKEWLSARDSHVRDTCALLDGQVVGVDENFRVPSGRHAGKEASEPGDFDHPELVVNCRCTTLPVVED